MSKKNCKEECEVSYINGVITGVGILGGLILFGLFTYKINSIDNNAQKALRVANDVYYLVGRVDNRSSKTESCINDNKTLKEIQKCLK